MKSIVYVILGMVIGSASYAGYFDSPKEVQYALDYGADTKVLFAVVDDQGNAICGAKIVAHFTLNNHKGKDVVGKTDEKGMLALCGKSVGEVVYSVEKDGYYKTRGRIWLSGSVRKHGIVKDGKWQPYGKMHDVLLKPQKTPVATSGVYFGCSFNHPVQNMGFDMKEADFITPYGKGVTADFFLNYHKKDGNGICEISFPNARDGAYLGRIDIGCEFTTVYHADTNAVYKKEFAFNIGKSTVVIPKDQYLVLRTRTKINEKGEMTDAYYSKIQGELCINNLGAVIKFYRNPISNSTNLEFDPRLGWRQKTTSR